MVSPVLNEAWWSGGFLVSEGNNYISRSVATISNTTTADVILNAGLVLAPAGPTATVTPAGTNHATGTIGSITLNGSFEPGNYTLTATGATTFNVTNPAGEAMPVATVGTAYSNAELGFTISNGTGTYVAGDNFVLSVPNPAGSNASPGTVVAYGTATLPASAILFNRAVIPAGSATKVTTIVRQAEVNQAELQWDPTILNAGTAMATFQANAIAQLGSLGIVAR